MKLFFHHKAKIFLLIILVYLSAILIWQVHLQNIQTLLIQNKLERLAETYNQKPRDTLSYTFKNNDLIFGGIIINTIKEKNIANFYTKLENQPPDTIVILKQQEEINDEFRIITSNSPLQTPHGLLKVDTETIKKLAEYNIIQSEDLVVNNDKDISLQANFIKEKFPKTKIIPIFFNKNINSREAAYFANILHQNLPLNSVVVALLNFSSEKDITTKFHNNLTLEVIKNFDFSTIYKLDIDSKAALFTLLDYLILKGSAKTQISENFIYFTKGKKQNERAVNILSFGDIMFDRYVEYLMDHQGQDYPFKNLPKNFFLSTDFVWGNLEGPIVKEPIFFGLTGMTFNFRENIPDLLKKYQFNVINLANNHIFNRGESGYLETKQILKEKDLAFFGSPKYPSKEDVFFKNIGGQKIAFIGFNSSDFNLDYNQAANLIRETRGQADIIIVSIHWGSEYIPQPHNWQREKAHLFIDSGADVVFGHHPHVVQSIENYNGKLIFYSLGNFIFDQYWSYDAQIQLAVGLTIKEKSYLYYLFPMKSEMSQARLMNEDEKGVFFEKLIQYSYIDDQIKEQIKRGEIEIER